MQRISPKQCKTARGLLKWNISDLINHMRRNPPARRIESFERGAGFLMEWEHQEVLKTFKEAGLVFRADMEVAFQEDEMQAVEGDSSFQGNETRIEIGSGGAILKDTSTGIDLYAEEEEDENDERKKNNKKQQDEKK